MIQRKYVGNSSWYDSMRHNWHVAWRQFHSPMYWNIYTVGRINCGSSKRWQQDFALRIRVVREGLLPSLCPFSLLFYTIHSHFFFQFHLLDTTYMRRAFLFRSLFCPLSLIYDILHTRTIDPTDDRSHAIATNGKKQRWLRIEIVRKFWKFDILGFFKQKWK